VKNANLSFVEGLYAAFGRGDIAAILAAVAPDVRWEMVGRSADYVRFGARTGVAGVQDFFRILADNEDFTQFQPTEFYSEGDKVFVLGRLALKFKKTDRTVNTDWIHIFTIRDGKVVEFKEFLDTAQFVAASKG
jgi:uncharacterized protein